MVFYLYPGHLSEKEEGSLYCSGDYAICNDYIIGIPEKPALTSRGKKKCECKASWDSIKLKVLDEICQFCYSETVCAKFKELSGGRVNITPYNALRQSVYEEVSSDGDSGVTSHSWDSSSDNDSSDALFP